MRCGILMKGTKEEEGVSKQQKPDALISQTEKEKRRKKGKEVLKVSPKLGRHAVGRPSKGKKEKC